MGERESVSWREKESEGDGGPAGFGHRTGPRTRPMLLGKKEEEIARGATETGAHSRGKVQGAGWLGVKGIHLNFKDSSLSMLMTTSSYSTHSSFSKRM